MNTQNDFSQDFETHNEVHFCKQDKCNKETIHRVGIREQHAELTHFFVYMKHEYRHCSECANTQTIELEKVITPKEGNE